MTEHAVGALDVGCGTNKVQQAVGVDRLELPGVDVVADIERGLPFRDNSFRTIHCNHVLEHVDDLVAVLRELYRVASSGATIHVRVPAMHSRELLSDPTHVRSFTSRTLAYFTPGTAESEMHYADDIVLTPVSVRYRRDGSRALRALDACVQWIANRWPNLYEYRLSHLWPMSELVMAYRVVK